MEVSEPTIAMFYVSKFMALAPYTLGTNSKGIIEIRRSALFTIYSTTAITVLVFLTYNGLLFDANSEIPLRASFRMKSATSKVVTALDVSVVVLSTVAGTFCGVFGLRATRELNARLRKVDETIHSYSNFQRDRIRAIVMIVIPLLTICLLLTLDIWTWLDFASSGDLVGVHVDLNVQWYIPFYTLYLILTGLHINFANTAFGLSRRYYRLNNLLRNTFLLGSQKREDIKSIFEYLKIPFLEHRKESSSNYNPMKGKITTVKTISTPLNISTTFKQFPMDSYSNDGKNKSLLLKVLAENHESLGKCVALVSSSYGITVLFILVSCLLHLVATAYFLFLEMLSKRSDQYLWLQVLWILFHICRLLMVVEPCHRATRESKKTIQIICEIERKAHDPILTEEIKKFWQQLLVIDSEFSASGLCRVDRNILTSFSSAIATYLVILIQFQKTNG